MTDLHRRMAKGAAWLVLLRVFDRGLGFVSTLVLARLLVPADFGLIAMAMAILAALDLLSSFSFDLALIQNQQATRAHYDTAWTFAVLFGIFNGLCMLALAAPAAAFYNEPRVEGVMYALAACCFVQGFDNIGIVAFQKDLQLHKEFAFGMGKKLAGFVVTLSLALAFRSYWALIGGTIAMRVASLVLSYRLHEYRPRFSLAAASELFHFSKWLLLNNFMIFLSNRGTDFVIGRVGDARQLGLYSVAFELANLPTTELVWPIQRAVLPGYAQLAGNVEQLRAAGTQVIALVALLAVPMGVGVALLAEPFVMVLLGAGWLEAVPLVQVLAAFGTLRALQNPAGSIFLALGRPGLIAAGQAVHIVVAAALMFVLIPRMGTLGACWALLAGVGCAATVHYLRMLRLLEMPLGMLAAALWRPLVSCAVMALVLGAAQRTTLDHALPAAASLIALAVLGAVCFIALVLVLWRLQGRPWGAESAILNILNEQYQRRFQRWRSRTSP